MGPDRSVDGAARPTEGQPNRLLIYLLVAVSVISLWVLRPVLANGFINRDDPIYLAELARMGRFSLSSLGWMWTSLQLFYLQPIVWMTQMVDYQVWGMNPVGYHATNWLLHGIYVGLVGTLVWMLAGKVESVRAGERLAMSVGIALVCGIHPLQVEPVAWFSARNAVLSSVWMVAALCTYVRAVGDGDTKRGWWRATIILQAVALLTKPTALNLPLVMLGLDFFPLRRHVERPWWRLLGEKWLMIALSAAAAVGAVASQAGWLEGLDKFTLSARVLVATRGAVFYLWKLVWPAWLSPFYPLDNHVSLRSEEFLVPLLICVVITVVAVWGRNRLPVLVAAWWSYLALVGPVLGLVQAGSQAVADRYAYLAMTPVLIAFSSGILWMWRRSPVVVRAAFCLVAMAWLVFLGSRTRQQIGVWHDDLTLWGEVLADFPQDPLANYNAALALLKARRLPEARAAAARAVNYSDPRAPQLPMARATLGAIYLKTHDYNLAVEQLQQAVKADRALWAARYNLACAYARLGRLAEAYDELRAVIAAQPEYASPAARDGELRSLRDDPAYEARFIALIRGEGR